MNAADLLPTLRRLGLVGADALPALEALDGGVSSDIWRLETPDGAVCVKRALARLRTEKEWRAPVARNACEAAWIREAAAIVPDHVPRLVAEAPDDGLFVMEFLPPDRFPVWKSLLRDGIVSADTAGDVGDTLGRLHAATAGNQAVAARFANDHIFHQIRVEPYLLATAEAHADLAVPLRALAETTATTKRALVHGDVSPKNILVGPNGPVLIDAECACYGDPAFDAAFCLNHLLLKSLWRPQWTTDYVQCFAALAAAWLARVDWEPAAGIERRTARLLPGLMLARIDGKSPVEYITDEDDKDRVRAVSRRLLIRPVETLAGVCRTFMDGPEP